MKKRNFIKLISKLSCTLCALPFLTSVNFDKIKKKIYKKKFSKIWILDINDS
tara:strand:- start:1716 stop:1871 length:156 start_codon:yes stop_codon:yes gene_type:complete